MVWIRNGPTEKAQSSRRANTCSASAPSRTVYVLGDCMAVSYKSDVHTKSHTVVVGMSGVFSCWFFFFFFPIEIKWWNPGFNSGDDLLASGVEGKTLGALFRQTGILQNREEPLGEMDKSGKRLCAREEDNIFGERLIHSFTLRVSFQRVVATPSGALD